MPADLCWRGFCQQLLRTAFDQSLGDRGSEVACGSSYRSLLDDMRGLLAIPGDDHRMEVPQVVYAMTIRAQRQLAAATQRIQHACVAYSAAGSLRARTAW